MTGRLDQDLGPLPTEPAGGIYAGLFKPLLDVAGAVLGLFIASALILVVAVAIRFEGPGGVFFRQERIGRFGRRFRVWKFRTMVPGAEGMGTGLLVKDGDPRVTRLGRFLRATSIDEIPQLLNVFRGEMSMVGPRPTVASQVRQYDDFQRQRLRLKPGVTGLAQVAGRKSIPWDARIRIDVEYLRTISFGLDLRILFRTVGVVLTAKDPEARADYWGERQKADPPPGARSSEQDGSATRKPERSVRPPQGGGG